MADYTTIEVICDLSFRDILIAELAELNYDSFQETESGFISSVEISAFDEKALTQLFSRYEEGNVLWTSRETSKENWNKKWEENYPPIEIGEEIIVRAPFHNSSRSYKYEIVIMPKMSFGTGHHETTGLMLKNMARYDFANKSVLDAGCGTGILGIMASKLGANKIVAFDIEEWAFENAIENFQMNNAEAQVIKGSVKELPDTKYNYILANINRNVLLEQMRYYAQHLHQGGKLFISGFHKEDIETLSSEAANNDLKKEFESSENNWCLLILTN